MTEIVITKGEGNKMSGSVFHMVDVFAGERFQGNQLAVFMNGHLYSDEEMQRLAREINFSETTFILPRESSGNTFKVRIFTPNQEIPFAGHPTLGTAYIILRELLGDCGDSVVLDLKAGQIPVRAVLGPDNSIEKMVMKQLEPAFGPIMDTSLAAGILSLPEDQIESGYPVQEVSTGLPTIIVPLKTIQSVRNVRVNTSLLFNQFDRFKSRGILVFCPETYERGNNLNVRAFFHYFGVPEDPATGSSNGCLAGYLLKYRYFGTDSIDVRAEQGYEIGRKSILHLSGSAEGGAINVFVGGKVVHVARCQLV